MRPPTPSSLLAPRAGPSVIRRSIHTYRPRRPLTPLTRQSRSIFGFLQPKPKNPFKLQAEPELLIAQDDLFHILEDSPFADLRARAARIKTVSICPVSQENHGERVRVAFSCPDCGWPTHKNQERWEEGFEEHSEVCGRLRQVNEDDHDLRSGRSFPEFDNIPGAPRPLESQG